MKNSKVKNSKVKNSKVKNFKVKTIAALGLLVSLIPGCSSNDKYEIPKYSVISKTENIEQRKYEPQLIAEVRVTGNRDKAANKAFRILADYIFGNNTVPLTVSKEPKNSEIAMTAPVTQQSVSENISMTAPVTQKQEGAEDEWLVAFIMPSEYNVYTLPKPNDKRINIKTVDGHDSVAITFSGFWTDANFEKQHAILKDYITKNKLKPKGAPVFAYYNDPFTLPWNRRNEIIYNLEK